MDAETKGLVERAALRWCGEKREFSLGDVEYFRQNWQSLPGLNQHVIDEAAATITRLTAERDAERARAEGLCRLLRRGIGFVEDVKRGGHWVGPSWGDETNLWRGEARALLAMKGTDNA